MLSVGSYGCNLRCPFCQNASIACAGERDVPWREIAPAELVDAAASLVTEGNIGLAFTYNEPLVGLEFVRDTAHLAHERGLVNVLVSIGYVNDGPLHDVAPFIDAANIDLKGFTAEVYRELGGSLATTMHTIEAFAGCATAHLEVTMLIVPGLNDSREQLVEAARWLADLDRSIPLHITRFFPCYKMLNAEPTPVETIYSFANEARNYLDFVTCGNC